MGKGKAKLATALKLWRAAASMDQRTAAAQIGVSSSTYCRFEQGKGMDAENFMKLITWMMKP